MDYIALLWFIAISSIFGSLIGFFLRWLLGKWFGLFSQPVWFWTLIIVIAALALQGLGVPVSSYYASFFDWLADLLRKGLWIVEVI